MNIFDEVASLNETRNNWRIRVRITRMWPSIDNGRSNIRGFNIILLDNNDSHIQAFVQQTIWISLQDIVLEGNIYEIANFVVHDATGILQPVSNKKCIQFTRFTTIHLIADDDKDIPLHKFEFTEFGDLCYTLPDFTSDIKPLCSTDVIGAVENLEHERVIQTHYGERNVVCFSITNGSLSCKVSVWGDQIDNIRSLFEDNTETPIIIILANARPHILLDGIYISTSACTKILINENIPQVNVFRKRLIEVGYGVQVDGA